MLGEGKGLRPWVYYSVGKGLFRKLHRYSGGAILAVMLLLPWLRIAGEPALRIDLDGRRFYVLGQVFTALDTRLLLVVLLFSAIGLGFVAAMAGRVWCGYLCPQTIFLEEIIRRIETFIEGDRGARRRLDSSPWTPLKVFKKSSKWLLFAVVSFVLAMTFLSYFVDPIELWTMQRRPAAYFAAVFIGGLLYFDLAWFREQFCNYLCPYARIQGALMDRHSLVIGYDPRRGEPRLGTAGVDKKLVLSTGGCVDCGRCVAVCPQGIDIRNGFQLECIACGHCVDACTDVMKKKGHPSLIGYTTEARLQGEQPKFRLRPVVYGALLTGLAVVGVVMLLTRSPLDARITRTPGSDAMAVDGGGTRNVFEGHLWNNALVDHDIHIAVDGLPGAEVVTPQNPLHLRAGTDRSFPVFVTVPAGTATQRSQPFEFVFTSGDEELRREGTFLANPGGTR
jgi:cytochrome c oxidase accessory protein FixG